MARVSMIQQCIKTSWGPQKSCTLETLGSTLTYNSLILLYIIRTVPRKKKNRGASRTCACFFRSHPLPRRATNATNSPQTLQVPQPSPPVLKNEAAAGLCYTVYNIRHIGVFSVYGCYSVYRVKRLSLAHYSRTGCPGWLRLTHMTAPIQCYTVYNKLCCRVSPTRVELMPLRSRTALLLSYAFFSRGAPIGATLSRAALACCFDIRSRPENLGTKKSPLSGASSCVGYFTCPNRASASSTASCA